MITKTLLFGVLTFDTAKSMVIFTALPSSADQTNADFKEDSLATAVFVETHRPTRFLSDLRDYGFRVSVELQEWSEKETSRRIVEAGVQKIAIILPKEMIAKLAIEQNAEGAEGVLNENLLGYFDTIEEAEQWFIEK